jgi:hypothetical protein
MNLRRFALAFFLVIAHPGLPAQTAAVEPSSPFDFGLRKTVLLRIAVRLGPPALVAGSSANIVPIGPARYSAYGFITSVNGDPARGSWSAKILTTETRHAGGINATTWTFDITEPDGTPAGVITAIGMPDGRGLPLPEDLPIVGSTNAYFGASGTIRRSAVSGGSTDTGSQVLESGHYELNFVATLTPLCSPTVAMLDGLPAITHGKDFTAVTSNAPAEPGEILSLVATDLLPELKESTTWPADPQALSNAPVVLKVGGVAAKILYVGKYPVARSVYQINFQVPAEVHAGIVDVQISTGYIDGQVVSIPVR